MTIVELGVLPPLHLIMEMCSKETVAAAVAALRNLSIHRRNEAGLTFCRVSVNKVIFQNAKRSFLQGHIPTCKQVVYAR